MVLKWASNEYIVTGKLVQNMTGQEASDIKLKCIFETLNDKNVIAINKLHPKLPRAVCSLRATV
jgi:hypothetical protein